MALVRLEFHMCVLCDDGSYGAESMIQNKENPAHTHNGVAVQFSSKNRN